MENLIREVIELDKLARNMVSELENEKSNISDYLREERKKIEIKYKSEAKLKLEIEKKKMLSELEEQKKENEIEYLKKVAVLKASFDEKKSEWIEAIYLDCIKD